MSLPTFSDKWDRLTYLLAEYKLLVAGMFLGVVLLVWYYQPAIPSPPTEVASVAVGWILLGPICFPIGRKIALWLHYRGWPVVFHINSVTDTREKWFVPPETWENKEVDGPAPHLVNDRSDYEVREFDWMPEINELRVRGTWMSAAKDSELITSRTHMERIHDTLLSKAETLAQMRAEWSDRALDMQEKIINAGAEARERGQMVEMDAAQETYRKMRGDVEGDNPEEIVEANFRDLAEDERPGGPAAPPETNGEAPQENDGR